jgi:hypothetical protein
MWFFDVRGVLWGFDVGLFTTQSAYATTISLSVSGSITTTALPTSASGTTAVSDTNTTNISITTTTLPAIRYH